MLYIFRKIVSIIMTAVVIAFAGSNRAPPHNVKDSANIKLNFSILSDSHLEGNNLGRLNAFERVLLDVANTKTQNDAVVFLGDNTMNGQFIECNLFFGSVLTVLGSKNVLVAAGNHDFSNGEDAYAPYAEKFIAYNNTFLNAGLTKPYYYRIINGCYFIFLSSEDSTVNDMFVSDEQFDWFESVMKLAGESGKPIFVCSHHYFTLLSDGCIRSLKDIMVKYNNVFYLYGHTHMQLCEQSFADDDGIHTVNLPCLTAMMGDNNKPGECTGIGAQVEVYDSEVVVRARNFYYGTWVDRYEKTWELVK